MARLRVDNRFADRLPSLVGQAKAQKGGGWKEEEDWVRSTSPATTAVLRQLDLFHHHHHHHYYYWDWN